MDRYTAYHKMRKNFLPKLREVKGESKQWFIVKELNVGNASWQGYGRSNWGWLRLEIKQNHWSIPKKVAFYTNLKLMIKRTATDLDREPATTQQRHVFAKKYQVAAWGLLLPQKYQQ